jgi:hypothetical protein
MKSHIIKPSSHFKKNSLRKLELTSSVDSILYQINSKIESSNRENKCKLAMRIPSSFNIPEGIDHSTFRLEVYYNIVKILEEKGYKIKIKSFDKNGAPLNKTLGDNNVLYIGWEVETEIPINEMCQKLFKLNI